MNKAKRLAMSAVVVLLTVSLQACGHSAGPSSPPQSGALVASGSAVPSSLKITDWGPHETKVGVVFNKQPNGSAALWIRLNQSLDGSTASVEFNGVLLPGAISGNLVTAGVPANLYARPGSYKVQVVARKRGRSLQSEAVAFTVQ